MQSSVDGAAMRDQKEHPSGVAALYFFGLLVAIGLFSIVATNIARALLKV